MSDPVEKNSMDQSVKGDLLINNLVYRQPKSLSLAVNRTMKRQYFQRSSYGALETAVLDWNTGSDYVHPDNSYLTFTILLTGTAPVGGWGVGSAVNVIDSITIRSRSGTELDRVQRVNLWSKNDIRHSKSADWVSRYGTMMGYPGVGTALSGAAVKFVIPLSALSGFFRPVGGHLIPPQLASGLHIELALADHRTAVLLATGALTGYTLGSISMMCDCVTLSDDTQKTLNMESASSGLEYTYPRIFTSTNSVQSTAVNVQVRSAVSQANIVTGVLLTQANVLDEDSDSLISETWDVESWQVRLGSLYFPHQAIQNAGDGLESYMIAQQTYDKSRHPHAENSVALSDFTGGHGIMSASMEKDQSLNLSGMPINNSRVLECRATLQSYTNPIEFVVFLEYTAVAKAYIDNCIVSI
jgi:hypothetical protein